MTSFITIIAFTEYGYITTGVADEFYIEAREHLVLAVAILGLISTLLSSWTVNTRYQSQHDAHAEAERTLAKVCQAVRFPERTHPGEEGARQIAAHFHTQKAVFLSVTCASTSIPTRIVQAFRDLEHAMALKPYTFRAIQYERFYYGLWKVFTKRYMYPCSLPEIDISTSVLGKLVEEEFTKYNRGLEQLEEVAIKRHSMSSRRNSLDDPHEHSYRSHSRSTRTCTTSSTAAEV